MLNIDHVNFSSPKIGYLICHDLNKHFKLYMDYRQLILEKGYIDFNKLFKWQKKKKKKLKP